MEPKQHDNGHEGPDGRVPSPPGGHDRGKGQRAVSCDEATARVGETRRMEAGAQWYLPWISPPASWSFANLHPSHCLGASIPVTSVCQQPSKLSGTPPDAAPASDRSPRRTARWAMLHWASTPDRRFLQGGATGAPSHAYVGPASPLGAAAAISAPQPSRPTDRTHRLTPLETSPHHHT